MAPTRCCTCTTEHDRLQKLQEKKCYFTFKAGKKLSVIAIYVAIFSYRWKIK